VADVTIDLELAPGLGLPYEIGAEAALPVAEAAAFAAVSAVAGAALTLAPLFTLAVEEIADILAAARQGGSEPPDLFAWFAVACPEETAGAALAALFALPIVVQAEIRGPNAVAGWQAATDPEAVRSHHLRRYPDGVDAFAAWQVPGGDGRGVRVAGMERSWDLAHPDLAPANVVVLRPIFTTEDRDHGTATLGIVGARSTGVGLTGVAPGASLAVAPEGRDSPSAILLAARHVGRGGVVLLELGAVLHPHSQTAELPLEFYLANRIAIAAAVSLGVLVVEPAGNGSVNLDTHPSTATLRAPFPETGALIVAGGERESYLGDNHFGAGEWRAWAQTTGGPRARCFAEATFLAAPRTDAFGFEIEFGGTSGASAIVAGVAAAVQGVSIANPEGGRHLTGNELRAWLTDPQYGHAPAATSPTNPQAIGVMPSLEWLVEGLGVPRLPPATAIRHGSGSVLLMRPRRLDVDQIDVVHWREDTASFWWDLTSSGDARRANGHILALHARAVDALIAIDAVCPSQDGFVMHRPCIPATRQGLAEPWQVISKPSGHADAFRLSAPFTAAASEGRLLVCGVSVDGTAKTFIAERKPGSLDVFPMTQPAGPQQPTFATLDPFVRFHATPVLYDADGSIVVAGVDTTGLLWFASWTLGTGWSALTSVAAGFDPAEAPALAHDGPALHVIGVEPETRTLREVVRSPDAEGLFQWTAVRPIADPMMVTWGVPLSPHGPLAAATDGAGTLIAIGLTAEGRPVATERRVGLDWSPILFVPTVTTFARRAGVTIASPSAGVFLAFASDARGALYSARWTVLGWAPFLPV
jgi:hypothetical protein